MSNFSRYLTYTDEELVILVTQNDNNAFKLLYNRYWKKLLIQAYSKLQSQILAEEVVQDCFINFWKRRKRIELKYTFRTYIASVVRYEVMAQLAKSNKHSSFTEDIDGIVVEDHSTQQWLDFEELREHFETAVTALPEKCQLIFRLSREGGFTDKQISENLSISHKTVEAHIRKALKILRLTLGNFLMLLIISDILITT
ncbi:RNA polymerase sigma factor [Mucilaginibacter sp.]|jgi:RNA polymerase sigma-70 factor (ECF subfamily)|uniref:RNA polymerase sigma factor n=1 Tax=Mucilaginibacter sp. TaxID=1882438 RepID=UPI0035671CB1